MRRRHQGKLELTGCLEPGETEGKLSGDMDDIWTELSYILHHVPEPGKRPLNIRIEEERDAGRPVHLRPLDLPLG
jgi:hypothetical protein